MRYYQDPNNVPLFRGRERFRFMTMIVMLAVVGMLMLRARDSRTWRWFANENEKVSPATLAAFDKAVAQRRLAIAAISRRKSEEQRSLAEEPRSPAEEPLALALAPTAPDAGHAAPADPGPPPATPPDSQPSKAAAKLGPLADDVPPPDPATVPQAEKSEKETESPAAKPVDSRPAFTVGIGPSAEALAAEVPPPEPAIDPEFLRKISESEHSPTPSPGAEVSPGYAAAQQASSGPSTSKPFDPTSEGGGKNGSGDANSGMIKEELAVDEDPVERKDFKFECQAIDDKDVLRPEEMAAYWRLVRWVQDQSFKVMNSRARPGLLFSHFFEHPGRYRGELVRLKIRVTRATAHETEENGNALGVERVYDLWGHSDDSGYNPYSLAVTELPANFPLGHQIQEDVTFVGYFLKLMAYKAQDDKTRAAPMLIGRVVWHPTVLPVSPIDPTWLGVGLIVALIGVMLLVRFTFTMRPLRRPSRLPPLNEGEEVVPIETWLERVDSQPGTGQESPEAINHDHHGDKHSNGTGHVFPQRLDHTEDQER